MNKLQSLTKAFFVSCAVVLLAAGCNPLVQTNPEPAVTELTTEQAEPQTGEIVYQGQDNKTALEILQADYQVETETFAGVGEFVKSINGIAPASDQFWAFYVNGESSNVGASQYQTKSTDKIEWKLETINPDEE